jgi:VanZ family protein
MQIVKKLLSKRYPAILWTLLIFALLALPGSMIPQEENFSVPNFDKYIHATIFLVFVLLWSFYYGSRPDMKSRHFVFLIFLLACLYGIAMEYVQKYFIPRRDFDVNDILADVIGAACGYLIVMILFMRKWRRESR